ncbi:MAG: ATP-grasp domain-containing protein [Oscillospiraceae bacterium]|nr:ATP-grasp domain-containing protein [Oscillospiraceae bacterium]
MKNFVFISPNFPANYWQFCCALRINELRVLGIGDCPYDELSPELRENLDEYYRVDSLMNDDQVYRAVAFFIHKFGRIDWLESNNEFWLERDARLRQDFNISSGFRPEDMPCVKRKSRMKERYIAAGIPVARYHLVDDMAGCQAFLEEVGYPVVVKPDNGVGAVNTFKIKCREDLETFFRTKDDAEYIMEEFIDGTVCSYDAVVNSKGESIFETGNVSPISIMDIVNDQGSCLFYIRGKLPEDLRSAGRAAVRAFGVRSRFVHFEFFRLNSDQAIGKAGQIAALEVNMRPSGGMSPTMMNYANNTDVYQIWADMIAFDASRKDVGRRQFCAFLGRRDERHYALSDEQVRARFGEYLREEGPVDGALRTDMGDYSFLFVFDTQEELEAVCAQVLREE